MSEENNSNVEEENEEIHTGVCIWFNVARGFGFLRDHKIGDDVFIHFSKIDSPLGEFRMLDSGDEVSFNRFVVERGDKRKNQAKNVKVIKKVNSITSEDK